MKPQALPGVTPTQKMEHIVLKPAQSRVRCPLLRVSAAGNHEQVHRLGEGVATSHPSSAPTTHYRERFFTANAQLLAQTRTERAS